MKELDQKRQIVLDGAHNVRDMGGYKTKDGNFTKWRKIIRADGLENLSSSDVKTLIDYGLKIDIDLRSEMECKSWIDIFEKSSEVEYFRISLLKDLKMTSDTLGGVYIDTADSCKKEFLEIFRIMAKNPEKTILFHCTAGKDRTGMTAALLLMLAKVDREDIIENYTVTTENLQAILEKFSYENDEHLKNYLGSEGKNIEKFIDHIENKYKGVKAYMREIGLQENEINKLKESIIEKDKM